MTTAELHTAALDHDLADLADVIEGVLGSSGSRGMSPARAARAARCSTGQARRAIAYLIARQRAYPDTTWRHVRPGRAA